MLEVTTTEPVAHNSALVPVQPVKLEPAVAVAEIVTVWSKVYVPPPLTLPDPVPAVFRVTVYVLGWKIAKGERLDT
jgi:hypothetical protein